MEVVPVLWSLSAGVAVTLAVVCGWLWLIERRNLATAMLCVLGVATAASALTELGMMLSTTGAECGEWLRWYHVPCFIIFISQVLFVHYYLGTDRLWLMWTFVLVRSAVLIVNFLVHPNFHFSEIESLRTVTLFGGQVSAIHEATPRVEWQWLATVSMILLIAYVVDATLRLWREGRPESRRKALAVGVALIVPLLPTLFYGQLLVYGFISGPISNLAWFLGGLAMMAFEVGRNFVVSKRARLEMAELRVQLAQADRVNLMGRLSSALTHELGQPLVAIRLNKDAAKRLLREGNTEASRLNTILDNIGEADERAVEIIRSMGQLFKQRQIEMHRLNVQDVMENVISLVRAEANSKEVAISIIIPPALPDVFGDRVHISQVLLNLLLNSIQALQSRPRSDRRVVVEARVSRESEVEIVVRDTGPGIPEAIVAEVFKPFFTTKSDGMGVGLALSRTIVEAHGGRMWVDARKPEDGAVIHFTLRPVAA
jgi:signal transduction histidine kinase